MAEKRPEKVSIQRLFWLHVHVNRRVIRDSVVKYCSSMPFKQSSIHWYQLHSAFPPEWASLMLKERKVLCINTFFPAKKIPIKEIHGFERPLCFILIHFKLSFDHRPLKTVFQFPSAYVNVLFRIFFNRYICEHSRFTCDDLCFPWYTLSAGHGLTVEIVPLQTLANPFPTSERSTKVGK